MKEILIKSLDAEIGIVYTYLLGREDANRILKNLGVHLFEIEDGWFGFRGDKVYIKKGSGSPALLRMDEVINQIKEQL